MKKILCLCLALALCLGLGLPAKAESADEQLREVTRRVKTALDVSDDYTEFNGDSYVRGQRTWWRLSWTKEDESLQVVCDDEGKVFSLDRWFGNEDYGDSGRLHFPEFGYDQAAEAAAKFLPRVLAADETVKFSPQQDSLRPARRYSLRGDLALNGVDTEIGVYLSFRTADGVLTSFRRDDAELFVTGETPAPEAQIGPEEALAAFREALSLELSWLPTEEDAHLARLAYTVNWDRSVMVDAKTGELLDKRSAGRWFYANGAMEAPEAAMDEAAGEKSLTPQELAGAEKYVGVLDGEALKAAAMKEAAFGLTEDYVLGTVTYRPAQPGVDPAALEEGETADNSVVASFRLSRTLTGPDFGLTEQEYEALLEQGFQPTVRKDLTADARTGEVLSLYTRYVGFGWQEREAAPEPGISDAALAFLRRQYASELPLCELTEAHQETWSVPVNVFTYTRMEAGYPCPMNSILVRVNASTGFVDSFKCAWDEELRFGPSGPVVGEEAALDSFLGCYTAHLTYVLQPEDPENWETAYRRLLVYLPDGGDGWVSRVDAVTGKADHHTYEDLAPIAYTDLTGSYAREEILRLAQYGVGFRGVEEFRPKAAVTELDMLLMMLSATGWQGNYEDYASADAEALRWLSQEGARRGFLASTEQHPDRTVTRCELCRCFVGLSGLTEAAELPDIFRCGFTDDEAIPASDLGFVAIAKGLGVVQGDETGAFRPLDGASRQELALMLCRYLSR